MKRLISKLGVALPIMMAMAVMMPGTANATEAGAAVVTGAGTISPGLLLTVPRNQTFTFDGTATGLLATTQPAAMTSCSIHASGNSTLPGGETAAIGLGVGNATCTGTNLLGGTSVVVCAFTYARVGAVVVIGPVVVNADLTVSVGGCVGVFIFVPSNTEPTTAYTLAGVAGVVVP